MFDEYSLQAKKKKYKEVTKTTYKQSISTELSSISVDLYTVHGSTPTELLGTSYQRLPRSIP